QIDVCAQETREPDGICRADGDHLVRGPKRLDRRGIPSWREHVAADLLVILEVEARVDDCVVDPFAAQLEGALDAARREFGPPARPANARQHPEAAVRRDVALGDALKFELRERTRAREPA